MVKYRSEPRASPNVKASLDYHMLAGGATIEIAVQVDTIRGGTLRWLYALFFIRAASARRLSPLV